MTPHALLVSADVVRSDPALASGARGERKIVVRSRRESGERAATNAVWLAPGPGEDADVVESTHLEFAVFTHEAAQSRHVHSGATEIYTLIDGEMGVDVEGEVFRLLPGDALCVMPGASHEVLRGDVPFLCRVMLAGTALDRREEPVVD